LNPELPVNRARQIVNLYVSRTTNAWVRSIRGAFMRNYPFGARHFPKRADFVAALVARRNFCMVGGELCRRPKFGCGEFSSVTADCAAALDPDQMQQPGLCHYIRYTQVVL
jgi:hypothetical protein